MDDKAVSIQTTKMPSSTINENDKAMLSKAKNDSARFQADRRQLAGLLLVTSFAVIVFPLAEIAGTLPVDEGSPLPPAAKAGLVGGLFEVAYAVISVAAAYSDVVHDAGHRYMYLFLSVFVQTA